MDRKQAYVNYFDQLNNERAILEEIYAPLREKLKGENIEKANQLEFFARIEFDVDSFYKKAESIVDFSKTGLYYHEHNQLLIDIKTIAEKIELDDDKSAYEVIEDLHNRFRAGDVHTKRGIDTQLKGKSTTLDFYNWIFSVSDFRVTYGIRYEGTNIELLSPGRKGIVLLLMYLSIDTEGSSPLIIDQPEENLDNKAVYKHLMSYFREAKKRRQIIIVTHNPNLVINTDAEQVIVANFEVVPKNQSARIEYISGAMENSFINGKLMSLERQGIKEHGIDLLEGGIDAFKNRSRKYEPIH